MKEEDELFGVVYATKNGKQVLDALLRYSGIDHHVPIFQNKIELGRHIGRMDVGQYIKERIKNESR